MENWWVELIAGSQNLADAKIHWGIYQEDSHSPLLCVISMMSLNHVVRIYLRGNNFSKSKLKINYLLCMYDIKLSAKNEKKLVILLQTIRIWRPDIGTESGIEKRATPIMKSTKW